MRLTRALFLPVCLALAGPARADSQPVRVTYSAPAGCGSREEFVRELRQRTPRVEVSEGTEPAATFVVELSDRGTRVVGQLRLLEPNGTETARAVSGATCEEVVPALALIAAVLVDPESLSRAERAPAGPAPETIAPSTPPAHDEQGWRLRPSLGAGAVVSTPVGPGVPFGVLLELGLESERAGRRGPALLLTGARVTSPTQTTRAGDASFTATFGRLTFCPLRWPTVGPVFLAPCGAFEAGRLHAEPSRTLAKQPVSVPWLALEPGLSLAYRPLAALGLSVGALAVFPLRRDRFTFRPFDPGAPDILAFSVPSLGVAAQAGVTAVWP
jgi:hypothetical protein